MSFHRRQHFSRPRPCKQWCTERQSLHGRGAWMVLFMIFMVVFHRSKIFCGYIYIYVGYSSFQSKYNIYNVYDYMMVYTRIYIYIFTVYIYIYVNVNISIYTYKWALSSSYQVPPFFRKKTPVSPMLGAGSSGESHLDSQQYPGDFSFFFATKNTELLYCGYVF